MKNFFLITGGIMLVAVLATVLVWWLLQMSLPAPEQTLTPVEETTEQSATTSDKSISGSGDEPDIVSEHEPEETAPQNFIELSAGQRKAADALGVNPDALSVTPAMIDCAKAKLSPERIVELVGGATPTFSEGLSLLPCLSAE